MAHKKAGGSTRNGRDSESKRLGVKRYAGENVLPTADAPNCAARTPSSTLVIPQIFTNIGQVSPQAIISRINGRGSS